MSISAIPIGRPSLRACSTIWASSPTRAPWFSNPVSGSRRVASTRATVWRLIRPCADRKTSDSAMAATIAAVSVVITIACRSRSSSARIGTASRQTPTTAWTRPSASSGKYSRSTLGVDRGGPAASLTPTSAIWAAIVWPSAAARKSGDPAAASPLTSARSLAMIVPSGRRSSTRRISARRTRRARSASSDARRVAVGPSASMSPGETYVLTTLRMSAASVPTTDDSVDVEKLDETSIVWAVAVTPTMTRKIP